MVRNVIPAARTSPGYVDQIVTPEDSFFTTRNSEDSGVPDSQYQACAPPTLLVSTREVEHHVHGVLQH